MTSTIEIRRLEGLSNLEPGAWNRLVGRESPFLEYGFLHSLEASGCLTPRSGWFPRIITAYDGDDLVGAVPFYIKENSTGEFVFDWGWADAAYGAGIPYYPKAVVAVPFTPVTGARILTAPHREDGEKIAKMLVESSLQLADDQNLSSVHFNFIPATDRRLFEDLGLPIRLGVQYHWRNDDGRGAPLEDFGDFLSRFRSKKRANIRRERRRLAESGVDTEIRLGPELSTDDMSRVFHYYRDTVQKFYYGQQYLNEEFFQRLRRALPERLHVVFARQQDETFAGAFNLFKENRLYGRYWGCERDVAFAHFETCFYGPIQWCIDEGIEVFEPGAGGEHKFDRGFEPTLTYSAHYIRQPALRRGVTEFIARETELIGRQMAQLRRDSPLKVHGA